jgi:hypothetical protein
MQIASGQQPELGTTFISWMLKLESVGPYIDMLVALFSASQLIQHIWRHFWTLPMRT